MIKYSQPQNLYVWTSQLSVRLLPKVVGLTKSTNWFKLLVPEPVQTLSVGSWLVDYGARCWSTTTSTSDTSRNLSVRVYQNALESLTLRTYY